MKQFKIRVEKPWNGCHAAEFWIQADSILEAGNSLMDKMSTFGVEEDQVSKLIETETPRHRPDTHSFDYPACNLGHPTRREGVHIYQKDYESHCT